MFAYEQCILCLGHHPDVWYEYASYLDENSKIMADKGDVNQHKTLQDEVSSIYERATTTLLKNNVLINFAYADFEEVRNLIIDAIFYNWRIFCLYFIVAKSKGRIR